MQNETRVRVNFSAGEIEIAGDSEWVREWWKVLEGDIGDFRRRFAGGLITAPRASTSGPGAIAERSRTIAPIVPETFGEFLHQFPSSLTDIERALVAAFFAQSKSESNRFTTGDVNELLIQHGVRLTNASASVKRNVDARRAIVLGAGHFRVSQSGAEHLGRLQEQQD